MKKNDILRVRIDAKTLAALKDASEASGCNFSHLVRDTLNRGLAQRSKNMVAPESPASCSRPSNDDRRLCAQSLSSLLVGFYSNTSSGAKGLQQRKRKIFQLLDALFRELSRVSDVTCREEPKATAHSENLYIAGPEQIARPNAGDRALGNSIGTPSPRQADAGSTHLAD
jgi:hypothetical protein